jgi:hypothetical protein
VNTLINQLIDAGTLATLQGGFVGRGIKMKGGELAFTPGQWKSVNVSGGALKDNIVPLPIKEPSNVLFSLLGMLIQAGKEISSVTEMMQGQNPGQNTAATTANAMVEQGMKVFTGIFARIHRSLGKEHKQLFMLNKKYHDPQKMEVILDSGEAEEILKEDYLTDNIDIKVASDPNMITDLQQQAKEQSLAELVQLGTVNPTFIAKQRLTRLGFTPEEIKEAMTMPEPPPDPKVLQLQLETEKFEHQKTMDQMQLQADEEYRGAEAEKDLAEVKFKLAKVAEIESNGQLKEIELMFKGELEERREQIETMLKAVQADKTLNESKKIAEETKHVGKEPAGGASRKPASKST